jgi:hypothetical protein
MKPPHCWPPRSSRRCPPRGLLLRTGGAGSAQGPWWGRFMLPGSRFAAEENQDDTVALRPVAVVRVVALQTCLRWRENGVGAPWRACLPLPRAGETDVAWRRRIAPLEPFSLSHLWERVGVRARPRAYHRPCDANAARCLLLSFPCGLCASVSSVLKRRPRMRRSLSNTEDTEAQRTQSQCSRRRGKFLGRAGVRARPPHAPTLQKNCVGCSRDGPWDARTMTQSSRGADRVPPLDPPASQAALLDECGVRRPRPHPGPLPRAGEGDRRRGDRNAVARASCRRGSRFAALEN